MLASPLLKGSALMGELFGSAAPAETADPMMDVINVFVFEKLAKTTVGVARPYLGIELLWAAGRVPHS